jgi:hypothetical protein
VGEHGPRLPAPGGAGPPGHPARSPDGRADG